KSSQETNTTPEEVYTPKGRSLGEQIKDCVAELRCLVDGMIELGGFFILLGMEKIGKSTFLMQLAIAIANGTNYEFLPQEEQKTHSPLKVLYIDLEMKIRELKERLKNIAIPTNLLWESEINNPGSLISYIRENIKGCTECVVILDNLKYIAGKSTNHNEVFCIFKALQDLQKELSQEGITLTIIVANHTVKGYNKYRPISASDAASSAGISQFSTGVIALAPAKDGMTMIKKVTSRNFPNDDTVLVVKMVKEPYQHFKYVKTCSEAEALPIETKACEAPTPGKANNDEQIVKGMKAAGLNENQIKQVLELDDEIDRIKTMYSFGLTQEKIGEIIGRCRRTIIRKLEENCNEAK
ncbi:MAG: AAA family ATPase, partial [Bacteroidaceae bacterium]|nr:AAA family ATPase [Bacteroidaceae bacterium]